MPPRGGRTASGTAPVSGPETDLRIHAHQRVVAGTGPRALPWTHQPGRQSATKNTFELSSLRPAAALFSLGGRAFRPGAVPGWDRPLSRGKGADGPLRGRRLSRPQRVQRLRSGTLPESAPPLRQCPGSRFGIRIPAGGARFRRASRRASQSRIELEPFRHLTACPKKPSGPTCPGASDPGPH